MQDLEQLFDQNIDCYADTCINKEGLIGPIGEMTKETFVKVVNQLLSNLYSTEILPLEKVTRLEVIDEKGRSYINWNKRNVIALSFQDELKTLKIFISKEND